MRWLLLDDVPIGGNGAVVIPQTFFAQKTDAHIQRNDLLLIQRQRHSCRKQANQLLVVANPVVVNFQRVQRLAIRRVYCMQLFKKAHRLGDIAQLGRRNPRTSAQDFNPLAVVAHQLRTPLIGREQLFPLIAAGVDPLQRRLRGVILGVRLQRAGVAGHGIVKQLQILKLHLSPTQMQVGRTIRATLLRLD